MEKYILILRGYGLSYNEIALRLGCAKSTVSYFCGQDQKLKRARRQYDHRSAAVKLIQESKRGKACMDCGEEYPAFMMDYDHRPDEDKRFNISQYKSKNSSLQALQAEINKCDLVCANCHRMRTWMRQVTSGNSAWRNHPVTSGRYDSGESLGPENHAGAEAPGGSTPLPSSKL